MKETKTVLQHLQRRRLKVKAGGELPSGTVKRCYFCSRERSSGISVIGMFICPSCEEEIVSLSWGEGGYTKYYLHLKKFWKDVETGEGSFIEKEK